ncbi:MAG: uL15 family ribosomal protein [archaeon]|jgi:large subunit ribosomal protein L18e
MAKKLETIKLIASLEKAAKATKKEIWADLASRMDSPTRNALTVSIEHVNKMVALNKGKTIIVPGKILSDGEMEQKAVIVAVAASESAKTKINKKGEFVLLKDFAEKAAKVKASDLVIIG